MQENQLEKFIAAIKADESLRQRLQSSENVGEIIAIANQLSIKISKEDFEKVRTEEVHELSDTDLETVSGGTMCTSSTNGCEGVTIMFSVLTVLDGGC